jgi:hypothetical protein
MTLPPLPVSYQWRKNGELNDRSDFMGDDSGTRQYSVYITAGAWYDKVVVIPKVDAVDGTGVISKALAAHPFPVGVMFGDEREPIEIDLVEVSAQAAEAVQVDNGDWRVRMVAHVHGCGTFLQDYADAGSAADDGVLLFPGWPNEFGAGWVFSQRDYVEVEEVEPAERVRTLETAMDAEPSSPSLAGAA